MGLLELAHTLFSRYEGPDLVYPRWSGIATSWQKKVKWKKRKSRAGTLRLQIQIQLYIYLGRIKAEIRSDVEM